MTDIIFLSALPSIFIATIRLVAWTVVHLYKILFYVRTNLFLIGSGYEENLCALIVRKRESFYFAFKIKAIADAEYKEIWNKVTCYKVPGMKATLFVISLLPFRIGNWIYKMIFYLKQQICQIEKMPSTVTLQSELGTVERRLKLVTQLKV